jgi:endonuclease/exonuclease/phosphatase family metal-dependent hydrolase
VNPLRLLTLNALMKGDVRPRLRVLGGVLESSGYDVVCLQEVMWRANAGLIKGLALSYGYHVHTGAVLLEGGLVTLSRLPVSDARFVRYPMTAPVRPEFLMRKGAQVVTVETGDGPVTMVNTHLSANRDDDWSVSNRYTRLQRVELEKLTEAVSAVDPARPLVVVGDLNVPRSSPLLADFLAAAGLDDARAGDPEPTYRPTVQWPRPPAFDHVLLRPGLAARTKLVFQEAVVLAGGKPEFLSDHYGVEADISVAP